MTRKEMLFYASGFVLGGLALWMILAGSEPLNKAFLQSDLSRLNELTWYELLLGFVAIFASLFLLVRSVLFPVVYLAAYTFKWIRTKQRM